MFVCLIYCISLLLYLFMLISLNFSSVSSFPVCLFFIILISEPHGFVSITFGYSVPYLNPSDESLWSMLLYPLSSNLQ